MLQTSDSSQHCMNAAIALILRHTWIVWMTGQLHSAFLGDGYHAIDEVADSFPVLIGICRTGLGKRRRLRGFVIDERAVRTPAATRRRFGANHAQDAHIIF